MARHRHPREEELRAHFRTTNCVCTFCLLFFSMDDPSDSDLCIYQSHLEARHGLILREIEP